MLTCIAYDRNTYDRFTCGGLKWLTVAKGCLVVKAMRRKCVQSNEDSDNRIVALLS